MSISLAVLGSGSKGNATLVQCTGNGRPRWFLIDAGLSPRDTARRLHAFGVRLDQLDDILLTHLDRDHFRETWSKACTRHGIRLHVHRRHRSRIPNPEMAGDRLRIFDDQFDLVPDLTVEPVLLAHDALGTVGFVINHAGERLGYATDLGRVPDALLHAFCDLDYVAIESNYDREMQLRSTRPEFLKRRIMGGAGHLSNDQSLDAVLQIAAQSRLRHIVLLHLSRDCNRPELVESLYERRARALLAHLTFSHQSDPTPLLTGADALHPIVITGQYAKSTLFA